MKLFNQITELRNLARKSGEKDKLEVYKLVLSDCEKYLADNNKVPDEVALKIIKKMIKSNNKVLEHKDSPELVRENEVLSVFVPQSLTEAQTLLYLAKEELKSFDNDGQAITAAMQMVSGQLVDNKIVVKLVKEIRNV